MRTEEAAYSIEGTCQKTMSEFLAYSEKGWVSGYAGHPDIGYFGEATSGENGIRTFANYVFTIAVLLKEGIEVRNGDKTLLKSRALSSIRYLVRTHKSGDLQCVDGKKWGGGWQTSWWSMKLIFAGQLLKDFLPDDLSKKMDALLEYEANAHLERIVPSGLVEDTKAEENAWDNEILAAACAFLEGHPNVPLWQSKLDEFAINTLSVATDKISDKSCGDVRVKDLSYTTNLHSDFTVENHGALHFCYIASPLLSISWSMMAFVYAGKPVPKTLFHNVSEFWSMAKPMFLGDRFAYIGGKDWARYTYGLYFILPALYMIAHSLGDEDAISILKNRMTTLANEQSENGDGSFYGKRLTNSIMRGQLAKYETDCFACFGLLNLMSKHILPELDSVKVKYPFEKTLVSPESETAFARSSTLFTSFSWRTLTEFDPMALFVPVGFDDLAEWKKLNLLGSVRLREDVTPVGVKSMRETDDGYIVRGLVDYRGSKGVLYQRTICFDVNMRAGSVIVESKLVSRKKVFCLQSEALSFSVGNDRFNDFERRYRSDVGEYVSVFNPDFEFGKVWEHSKAQKVLKLLGVYEDRAVAGKEWLNIDDKITVMPLSDTAENLVLYSPKYRNTRAGCLHFETVCLGDRRTMYWWKPGEVIFECRVLLANETAKQAQAALSSRRHIHLPSEA